MAMAIPWSAAWDWASHKRPLVRERPGQLITETPERAEQHIKEGKNAIKWTRLSCHSFAANAVRLQLRALAHNSANFLRTSVSPAQIAPYTILEAE